MTPDVRAIDTALDERQTHLNRLGLHAAAWVDACTADDTVMMGVCHACMVVARDAFATADAAYQQARADLR